MMVFEERRHADPQGTIDDLLVQITQQAVALYEKSEADKVAKIAQDVLDGKIKAPKKATAKKKEAVGGE